MSMISVRPEYTHQLFLAEDRASFEYKWDQHTIRFSQTGAILFTEIELSIAEQESLVRCLAFDDPSMVPHWQNLTPALHRTVERIANQIREASIKVDNCIRQTPKGIRLAPLRFDKRYINQSQGFVVVYWLFNDEERERLRACFGHLGDTAKKAYKTGIMIPMPISYERRQIQLDRNEIDEIFKRIGTATRMEPYLSLYGIAWDNFIDRAFESAILILTASIETALKRWLSDNSDEIANFLLENVQSPKLDVLYDLARVKTELKLPGVYSPWLFGLNKKRNEIAHKPVEVGTSDLEIARWFAIGEALFKAMKGYPNDPLVGFLVEPVGEKTVEKFPPSSRGIVLRREEMDGENWLHVLIDTGDTWRFGDKACRKCKDQDIR